jgi:hypothetical protein
MLVIEDGMKSSGAWPSHGTVVDGIRLTNLTDLDSPKSLSSF